MKLGNIATMLGSLAIAFALTGVLLTHNSFGRFFRVDLFAAIGIVLSVVLVLVTLFMVKEDQQVKQ